MSPHADAGTAERIEAIAFGPFLLLPRQRELRRAGAPVPIGSRALDILILLAERAGEVVGNEEILARVWSGMRVEEGNLRVHIAGLRKALGDTGRKAKLIANVPNRGYALVSPVQTAAAPRAHIRLPRRLTTVLGRAACIATLAGEIGPHRFVTLVGPGGIGKSTVAIAVAERLAARFADGVAFVDFSGIGSPAVVAATVAGALGVPAASGDPRADLLAFLARRSVLVVFDCCEVAVEALALLAEAILKAAPDVCILATSREPLCGEGERLFRLPPLALPAPGSAPRLEAALSHAAIRLFAERAHAADDGFAATDANIAEIIEICRRLDGIPLAIEIVAARVAQMSLRELGDRLDGRFSLLIRGRRTAVARHQTLRATLDWSFDLLGADEQRLAMRLAIFRGAFSTDAAAAVAICDGSGDAVAVAEGVARLVDKSLVSVERGASAAHYRLLDVTRAYLIEKLEASGDFDAICGVHARYFLALLTDGPDPAEPRARRRLARSLDNIRAAIAWAFGPGGDADTGIALTLAARPLWTALGLTGEMRQMLAATPGGAG